MRVARGKRERHDPIAGFRNSLSGRSAGRRDTSASRWPFTEFELAVDGPGYCSPGNASVSRIDPGTLSQFPKSESVAVDGVA
jgi:hypothetical protein